MFFVILNHTTTRASLLLNDDGNIATFNDRKFAVLAGEDELGLENEVFNYLVVEKIPARIKPAGVKICSHCNRPYTHTEVPSGLFCCYACEYGY